MRKSCVYSGVHDPEQRSEILNGELIETVAGHKERGKRQNPEDLKYFLPAIDQVQRQVTQADVGPEPYRLLKCKRQIVRTKKRQEEQRGQCPKTPTVLPSL